MFKKIYTSIKANSTWHVSIQIVLSPLKNKTSLPNFFLFSPKQNSQVLFSDSPVSKFPIFLQTQTLINQGFFSDLGFDQKPDLGFKFWLWGREKERTLVRFVGITISTRKEKFVGYVVTVCLFLPTRWLNKSTSVLFRRRSSLSFFTSGVTITLLALSFSRLRASLVFLMSVSLVLFKHLIPKKKIGF